MKTRRLRLLTTYATSERSVQPGQVATFEEREALELLAGGYAVDVTEPEDSRETRAQSDGNLEDDNQDVTTTADATHTENNATDDEADMKSTELPEPETADSEANDSVESAGIETADVEQPETTGRRGGKRR